MQSNVYHSEITQINYLCPGRVQNEVGVVAYLDDLPSYLQALIVDSQD